MIQSNSGPSFYHRWGGQSRKKGVLEGRVLQAKREAELAAREKLRQLNQKPQEPAQQWDG